MKLAVGLTTSVRWRNLLACMESIDHQRSDIDDLLCVEDGITHPNIERICEDYGARFIQLPMPKPHRRLCECHNILFTQAQGDILVRGSQDQVFGPGFFAEAHISAEMHGRETIICPYTGYLDDDPVKGEDDTRYFNPGASRRIGWRFADRTVVIFWRAGIPLQDTDFDLVCSHDGVEWAWRLAKSGYGFWYEHSLKSYHIGHEVYPTPEQSAAAIALLTRKTEGEIFG